MKNEEEFSSIGEAKLYLMQDGPQLLEKAKKGKGVAVFELILMIIALVLMVVCSYIITTLPKEGNMIPLVRTSLLTFPTLFIYVGIILSIIAYHRGGGFRKYLGTFKEIAFWGWFLIPIFPVDLFIGLVTVTCGLMLMLYLPIIFISLHMKSIRKKMAKAEEYIRRQEQINALNAQAN